jgi:PAS domain S-box-containing protein
MMQDRNDKNAYQAIFQNSNLGIIISNREGIIEQVNPYANHLFGYDDMELIGKKIEVLVPKNSRDKHMEHRKHYNEAPRPRAMGAGMDLWAVKKDGTEFPVEISLALYETGNKREIVSFVSDITERKKAVEDLKRLHVELERKIEERTRELSQALLELRHINENLEKEMEYRNKAEEEARRTLEKEKELSELKSRFVSMASHEFRTPLSGILTSVSLIARYAKASEEEKRNRHIDTIKASVRHLTGILNDFLSLDKLEAGKVECRPSSFPLLRVVQELIEEMQTLAKKGQRIFYSHRGGEEVTVHMDRNMLRSVLINLISNAVKYSPEESEIKVETELYDSHVLFRIQDQGIGIPESEQKHLFERFFRAQNAMTTQGTGLGLNIVKRYLDLMGGSIHYTSRENGGTTFTITLPRGAAP